MTMAVSRMWPTAIIAPDPEVQTASSPVRTTAALSEATRRAKVVRIEEVTVRWVRVSTDIDRDARR
jgi:hypothetical protein